MWSVKYWNGDDAANSWPMNSIGVYGRNSSSADAAAIALDADLVMQTLAEGAIANLVVVLQDVHELPGRLLARGVPRRRRPLLLRVGWPSYSQPCSMQRATSSSVPA